MPNVANASRNAPPAPRFALQQPPPSPSVWQVESQPSPSVRLPSSQLSPSSTTPLPQLSPAPNALTMQTTLVPSNAVFGSVPRPIGAPASQAAVLVQSPTLPSSKSKHLIGVTGPT